MQRKTLLVPFLGASLAVAIAACGSDSKSSQPTTPVASEPAAPAEAAPEPAPAEPAQPPPPPAPTYLHGKWVWYELVSTDTEKSKSFYSQLLGWQIEPQEMGGMKFDLVKSGGQDIATLTAAEGKAKSHWVPFVSVPDVDATVKTVEEQKGKTVKPPADIPNIGRFAIVADPNGVEFAVFKGANGDQPDPQQPATGQFVWNEYLTKNKKQHAAALAFYPATIGYTASQMQMGEGKKKMAYDMLSFGEAPRAGVQAAKPTSLGGQWLPWVVVDDTDAMVALAKQLKGKIVVKAHDIPTIGRAAIVADSTGAAVGLLKPASPAEMKPAEGAQPPAEQGGEAKPDSGAESGKK
jgi:predicted enzyme related to lactoylglutathione lyase